MSITEVDCQRQIATSARFERYCLTSSRIGRLLGNAHRNAKATIGQPESVIAPIVHEQLPVCREFLPQHPGVHECDFARQTLPPHRQSI